MTERKEWKDLSYMQKHRRIAKIMPQPKKCSNCGREKTLELTNKDHKYSSNPEDWEWKCRSCHFSEDRNKSKNGTRYICYYCNQFVINYDGNAKRPQIRCQWCHKRFYLTEANKLAEKKPFLSSTVINGKPTQSSDVSVLRAFHLFLLKKHHRGPKVELINNLIKALEELKNGGT